MGKAMGLDRTSFRHKVRGLECVDFLIPDNRGGEAKRPRNNFVGLSDNDTKHNSHAIVNATSP